MNERFIRSLQDGMQNAGCYRDYDYWTRRHLDEALDVLENTEHSLLNEYDCYDYLAEDGLL